MLLTRLPLITSLILAAAIGGIIYLQVAEILLPNGNTVTQTASLPAMKASIPAQPQKKNFNIASYKLFGIVSKKAPVQEVIPEKLPTTKLKLTLTGVQAGDVEKESGALIEGPDRDTSYYKVGDQLPGNATLKRVFADRIVIQRSGKLENLYFPDSFSSGSGIQALSQKTPSTAPAAKKIQTIAPKMPALDDARKQTIKERLSKLRQRINSGQ